MNVLFRYLEVTNLSTLQTGKKRKKGKNTARNNTIEFHKYMPDRTIFSLPRKIKPPEEVSLTNL